ncbi:MAG: cytochrome c, partial [Gemmatimonadales bacterium]|nr:cytochrome c [Gemmatimonadales bacterium]
SPAAQRTGSGKAPSAQAPSTQIAPPPSAGGPDTTGGAKLFAAKGCVGCHALSATNASKGLIGPNLSNVGARRYIAAGTLLNTDENLARWIHNPQAIKVGVLMPNLGVSDEDARTLAQYLRTHK